MERRTIRVDKVFGINRIRHNLVKYVANHYDNEDRIEVNGDMSERRIRHAILHGINHFRKGKPHRIWLTNEANVLFWTGLEDPIGFASTSALKCKIEVLYHYWGMLAKNKNISQDAIDIIVLSKTGK